MTYITYRFNNCWSPRDYQVLHHSFCYKHFSGAHPTHLSRCRLIPEAVRFGLVAPWGSWSWMNSLPLSGRIKPLQRFSQTFDFFFFFLCQSSLLSLLFLFWGYFRHFIFNRVTHRFHDGDVLLPDDSGLLFLAKRCIVGDLFDLVLQLH